MLRPWTRRGESLRKRADDYFSPRRRERHGVPRPRSEPCLDEQGGLDRSVRTDRAGRNHCGHGPRDRFADAARDAGHRSLPASLQGGQRALHDGDDPDQDGHERTGKHGGYLHFRGQPAHHTPLRRPFGVQDVPPGTRVGAGALRFRPAHPRGICRHVGRAHRRCFGEYRRGSRQHFARYLPEAGRSEGFGARIRQTCRRRGEAARSGRSVAAAQPTRGRNGGDQASSLIPPEEHERVPNPGTSPIIRRVPSGEKSNRRDALRGPSPSDHQSAAPGHGA